ncbi:Tbc1 domain family member 14 [Favolaschia claudopus]|uniref:Tbc1 domain family member 14 n=1 Tax=Favolaschia claudopus TaxID=2862362 RepID=A0AAW0EJ29_9AGAR
MQLADIPPPSLDLDDAFADGDDDEQQFQFSTDSIRQDLARHEPSWADSEFEASIDSEHTQSFEDESVSTLDIDASDPRSPPESALDEDETNGYFSQISLSESVPDESSEDPVTQNDESPKDISPRKDDELTVPSPHPYPSVVIDASKPPAHRVTLSTSELPPISLRTLDEAAPRPASMESPRTEVPPWNHSNGASGAASSSLSIPPLPVPSSPKHPIHRPTRSTGPGALEKVMSRTRPSFLPPKSREEDLRHMGEWESMMKQSRISAEKRRRALQERRSEREKKIEDSLHVWEKEIVPDWRKVHKNPTLRKLWWQGIPAKLRASMWANAVGNALALSKDNYRTCLARAKRALGSGAFPSAALSLIEQDISTTLPSLHIFHHETGPLYADLKDMLCAWVVSRSDEGLGYTVGASKIAAMLLLNIPVQQAFIVMRNLMDRHCMRSFYGGEGTKEDVDAYYRIFDTLLADGMPKIYFNFKQHQISPAVYLPEWLLPLFLEHLPFEACARIWDVFLLEGDSFLYRAALGILAVLEPRLFFPDRKELIELLRGENKAALDVATREGRPLDGGRYEIYGVDEETVWDRIDSMQDWWKDSTWTRLIQRELPDL